MTERELINLRSDIEELRDRIGRLEDFILKMLDRIVELERERRHREGAA